MADFDHPELGEVQFGSRTALAESREVEWCPALPLQMMLDGRCASGTRLSSVAHCVYTYSRASCTKELGRMVEERMGSIWEPPGFQTIR